MFFILTALAVARLTITIGNVVMDKLLVAQDMGNRQYTLMVNDEEKEILVGETAPRIQRLEVFWSGICKYREVRMVEEVTRAHS